VFILSFIDLIFIEEETIFVKFIPLSMSNVDILGSQLLSVLCIKFDLFSVEIVRPALAKNQLILIPVIKHKLIVLQFEHILVVLDYEARRETMVYDVRNFFVMELQEVGKRFCEK